MCYIFGQEAFLRYSMFWGLSKPAQRLHLIVERLFELLICCGRSFQSRISENAVYWTFVYFNLRMGHLHHKEMCYFCWMLKQVDCRCKIFCIVSGFMNLVVRDIVLTLVANFIRGIWLSDI